MPDDVRALAPFLPRVLLDLLARTPGPRVGGEPLQGAVLAADISGFTSISERLASRGREGAEEVGRMLNALYGGFIAEVHLRGGDVVRFVGDMLLAVWPAQGPEALDRAARQAAATALALQDRRPPPGVLGEEIIIRAGVGLGSMTLVTVGGVLDRWDAVLVGDAVSQALHAQSRAAPGSVLLSGPAWRAMGDLAEGTPVDGGARLLRIDAPRQPVATLNPDPALTLALRAFVPGAVRSRVGVGQIRWLAELRGVTVLFIRLHDLELSADPRIDDFAALTRVIQERLYRFEGALDKFAVDEKGISVLGTFGLHPFSHEDDPLRAARAALAVREGISALGQRCSIGVATGRVFCGTLGSEARSEYTVLGSTVNLAARLMIAAAPGEVLCDEATRAAAGRMNVEALAPVQLKGFRQLVPMFRVLGQRSVEPGGGADRVGIIGRASTARRLAGGLERRAAGGEAGLVWLEGAPGIGKSGLLAHARATAERLGLRVWEGASDPIERLTPYHGWRAVFAAVTGYIGEESREDAAGRLLGLLANHVLFPYAGLFNTLLPLGLDEGETERLGPEARAERTRQLLCAALASAISSGPPAVLLLDDVHCFDSASWALLEAVVEELPELHVILGSRELGAEGGAIGRLLATPRLEHIALAPLDDESARQVLLALFGASAPSEPILRALVARAEGNPYYLSELARSLRIEGGPAAGFGWESQHPATLPMTLEGAVTSRMDRLPPEDQMILKVASVFGRPVDAVTLGAVLPVPLTHPELAAKLARLVESDWLRRVDGAEGIRWAFTNGLVRDAAYGLMTFAQRKSLHAAVAARLEDTSSVAGAVDLPVLAFHWVRAEVRDKAVDALERAGEAAARGFALEEVTRFFTKAIELMPDASPERRFRWNLRLGAARLRVGLANEARTWLLRALDAQGERPPERRWGLGFGVLGLVLTHPLRPAEPLAAEAEGRAREVARVWLELAWAEYFRLEPLASLYAMLRAVRAGRRLRPCYELAVAAASLSAYASLAGLSWIARRESARAQDALAITDDPAAAGAAWGVLGVEALARGDWGEARARLKRARIQDENAGLHEDGDLADLYLAGLDFALGSLAAASASVSQTIERGDRRGSPIVRVRGRFLAAALALATGQPELATGTLLELVQIGQRAGEELDAASASMARVAELIVPLLEGRPEVAGPLLAGLRADERLLQAALSPTSRLGDLLCWLTVRLAETLPVASERALALQAASRVASALRRRGRMAPLLAPVAARWLGRCAWVGGRPRAAARLWRAGLVTAARLEMPFEAALLQAELSRLDGPGARVEALARLDRMGADGERALLTLGI